ncbi:hypothetical protein ACFQ34_33490 [Pseudonocardia benzenivorans]|uniref:Uncharacterized protein n=1 Tax=Pseudonocardia benzenivorans TaxID=228005 RepID=A0ABW3VTN5_9PSEU
MNCQHCGTSVGDVPFSSGARLVELNTDPLIEHSPPRCASVQQAMRRAGHELPARQPCRFPAVSAALAGSADDTTREETT